jgi:hypothetical protein
MLSFAKLLRRGAPVLLLAVLAGCGGDGPKVVKVTGTLKYKGKPVPDALLNFEPEHGRLSWAETDAEGRFKINYDRHQDGAVVGKHKVWIEYRPTSATNAEPGMPANPARLSPEMRAFFAKYSSEKSKLKVEITPDTKDLDLDLD